MNRTIATCFVVASLVTPAAFAATDAPPTEVVRVSDLDLSRDRDVGILYQRLKFAAAAVCPAGGKDPARAARASSCRAQVLDRTVDQAHLPQLTALHRGKAGAGEGRFAHR